jgi:hypothetical protein
VPWTQPARDAGRVVVDLLKAISFIYMEYESVVHKFGIGALSKVSTSPQFSKFVTATAELQQVSLDPLDNQQRMAFFVNL